MIPGLLLATREVLEGALIVGIVLGALDKIERRDLRSIVWSGVCNGIVLSIVAGAIFYAVGVSFEGAAEQIFEGITMLLAAALLTWMIVWMHYHSRDVGKTLAQDVRQAVGRGGKRALFFVAFLAVVREGIELALFLTAAFFAAGAQDTILGAGAGTIMALMLAWLLFSTLVRFNLRHFFVVSGVLLILFAAGLVAHGIHELNEAGIVPVVVEHVWNMNHIVDEASAAGEILKTLFGYNGNPSLTETLAYFAYFIAIGLLLQRQEIKTTATRRS